MTSLDMEPPTLDGNEYVLMPINPTIGIIKILHEAIIPGQSLKQAKEKYERIIGLVGISTIVVDVVHECEELRKENKILTNKVESIKQRIMEVL